MPLYVILVGDPTGERRCERREQSPGFVLEMVRAANGAAAAPLAQTLASFFADDGVLLRKFVYRVRPDEGLEKIEPDGPPDRLSPAARGRAADLRLLRPPPPPHPGRPPRAPRALLPGPRGPRGRRARHSTSRVHVAADRLHRTRDGDLVRRRG